jgi:hypothetical protein
MKTSSTITTPTIEDRRTEAGAVERDDRRVAVSPRRKSPRYKTLKGARIVAHNAPFISCIVRNLSDTGAKIEVHGSVPYNTFDLVFDGDESRRSCSVVWRTENSIGVKFEI